METYLQKLRKGLALSALESECALLSLLNSAKDEEIKSFLLALKAKGETPEEITGFVRGLKKAAHRISPNVSGKLVDVVGTGGDLYNTINVSTAAAIITAASGVPVAKHGNRAITSLSGSSDVLLALGIKVDPSPETVQKAIEEIGLWLNAICMDRANARKVTVVMGRWDRIGWHAEPVMKALGKGFGKNSFTVKGLIEAADGNAIRPAVDAGQTYTPEKAGAKFEIGID
ncbi:MAG: hypothetical protein PHD26_04980, partial [Methanosarcinaceae archaeon]|nr:hypothetical protein [Methanosarcinaceae archaeon]